MSGKTKKPASGAELVKAPFRRWVVTSALVDRTPSNKPWQVTKTRVSKLRYLETPEQLPETGRSAMVLEGGNSDRILAEFADRLNAEGKEFIEHKRAFADMPETARRNSIVKNNALFVGAGFEEPKKNAARSGNSPKKADLAASEADG
jgi:hypothetical protein